MCRFYCIYSIKASSIKIFILYIKLYIVIVYIIQILKRKFYIHAIVIAFVSAELFLCNYHWIKYIIELNYIITYGLGILFWYQIVSIYLLSGYSLSNTIFHIPYFSKIKIMVWGEQIVKSSPRLSLTLWINLWKAFTRQ